MAPALYDLTVFGATGFTAKLFCALLAAELAKGEHTAYEALRRRGGGGQGQQHHEQKSFTWALAGRSRAALEAVVASLNLPPETRPALLVADVGEPASLLDMCRRSVLVLNCVGPYAFYGPPVLEAVLRASEERRRAEPGARGVSYLDITGEPSFIEKSCLEHHRRAQDLGITILHSAGFDSVPADIGVLVAKQKLVERGAEPTSIEAFFELVAGSKGFGIHYATYASAVNGFATRDVLAKTRKTLGNILPRPPRPAAVAVGLSDGLPRRTTKLPLVLHAPEFKDLSSTSTQRQGSRRGTYLLPFFFADPSVIRLSHALDADLKTGTPPIKLAMWINVPKLRWLFVVIASLSTFGLLATFRWGRALLLRFPKLFSGGRVSHEGPTTEQIKSTSFLLTLVARGHSKSALAQAQAQGAQQGKTAVDRQPDTRINVVVSGPEPGYDATPLCMLACVEAMLSPSQRDRVRHGVLTPSTALGATDIVQVLEAQPGGVRFKIVDPPQI